MLPEMKYLVTTMAKRRELKERFREQHQSLHPDRNLTAGLLYENTRQLEEAVEALLTADAAPSEGGAEA